MIKQVKKAAAKVAKADRESESERKVRTLSLADAPFRELQDVCSSNGWQVNRVIDELVAAFLDEMRKK